MLVKKKKHFVCEKWAPLFYKIIVVYELEPCDITKYICG